MYGTDFRTTMNEIWNQVFQSQLGNMTHAEASTVSSRYNNDAMNLANQLATIQQQRNGALSYQDVAQFLNNYITQIVSSLRQANNGYFGNAGMIPTPNMGMHPMGGGFGFSQPNYGYGYGMNRPMGGFGAPNPGFGFAQPQPFRPMGQNAAMMPSKQTYEMANMYDMKPSTPQPPAPTMNYQQSVPAAQSQPLTSTLPPVATTIPSTKINVDIEAYKEPLCEKTFKINGKKYGISDANCFDYVDQHNNKLSVVTATVDKWVKSIHTKLAEIVDAVKSNFVQLKYRTWHIENISYNSLSKTMFEIKDVIQKAKASTTDYDPFELLEMVLHVLDDKTRGCGNFVENLIVNKFNQYVYTTQLSVGLVESAKKILTFKDTVKDLTVMEKLDQILCAIIYTDLIETSIVDCASKEVDQYINDAECSGGRLVSEVKESDAEGFTKWAKAHCVVVSAQKITYWTNLQFNDMVQVLADDKFTIMSQPIVMDDSPIDTDLEYFVKTIGKSSLISNLLISIDNVVINYLVVTTDTNVSLKQAAIF